MKKTLRVKSGFTLVEMIMSIVIIAIIAGVAAPLLQVAADLLTLQLRGAALEESADYAVSRMSREIRRLSNDRSVVAASRNNFEFIDIDNRRIRYYLSGNTIRRTEDGTDRLFLEDVESTDGLLFYYYNDDTADTGETSEALATNPVAGLGTKTDIRYMKIWIRQLNTPQTHHMRQAMRLRNVQHRESDVFF
jgi:prepilin-type N-terminal cleavage/methylation domain-containing protein